MADDLKPKTKREADLMRAAYARGRIEAPVGWGEEMPRVVRLADEHAKVTYPYPTRPVERPRVVADPDPNEFAEWCVEGDVLRRRSTSPDEHKPEWGPWILWRIPPTRDRVALWNDLFANPTETVEEPVE